MTSFTRSVLLGAAWNYAGVAVLVVTQIVSTAASARLIAPAEFGAYATAQAAAGIFGFFTLSAVGQGLLRRSHLGPRTVGTATVISLTSGIAVGLVMWLVAVPWSEVWHVDDSAPLIRVIALSLFLTSCATVPLALLRRDLRFRAAAIAEVSTQVLGVTAGILLAVQMHSAMALVIGQAVTAATLLMAAATLSRRELRLDFAAPEARELLSFAGQVSAQNVGFFTLYTTPSWVIARLFGASALGLYSRANLIIGLPLHYLTTALIKVIYPFYGRVGTQLSRTKVLLSEAITIATGFSWVLFALVAGASPVVVDVLLGTGWDGTAELIRVCALIACANLPWVLLANSAEAFGWMRLVWLMQVAYALVLGTGIALAYIESLGVVSVLLAVAAAQWMAYFLLVAAFVRRGVLDPRAVLSGHVIHGAVAVCGFAVAAYCAHLLRGQPLLVQTSCQLVVGLAVCSVFVVGRFWIPCSTLLGRRLAVAADGNSSRLLTRLGFGAHGTTGP